MVVVEDVGGVVELAAGAVVVVGVGRLVGVVGSVEGRVLVAGTPCLLPIPVPANINPVAAPPATTVRATPKRSRVWRVSLTMPEHRTGAGQPQVTNVTLTSCPRGI